MKKALVVDITGTTYLYTWQLCESMASENQWNITLAKPYRTGFDNVNPASKILFKQFRLFRYPIYESLPFAVRAFSTALGVSINYFFLLIHIFIYHYDIIHFQWLPLINSEKSSLKWVEFGFLRLCRIIAGKNTKFVFTVHNLFPHRFKNKEKYKQRFLLFSGCFDSYIIHTTQGKIDFHKIYGIPLEKIYVVFHGIFVHNLSAVKPLPDSDKFRILHYGRLGTFKGTDVLVDALLMLPESYQERIEAFLMGNIEKNYYEELSTRTSKMNIHWFPYTIEDEFLCRYLMSSDLIILPYRSITQSGVLLESLFFEKRILTSDLPSFKETLEGFYEDWFFKSEDVKSLADAMMRHIDNRIDKDEMNGVIKALKQKYSWEQSAAATLYVYQSLLS